MTLPRDTTGLSAVFDCDISLSYSLTIVTKMCRELSFHGLGKQIKGYLHLCPRMNFFKLCTLITQYIKTLKLFIEFDSKK